MINPSAHCSGSTLPRASWKSRLLWIPRTQGAPVSPSQEGSGAPGAGNREPVFPDISEASGMCTRSTNVPPFGVDSVALLGFALLPLPKKEHWPPCPRSPSWLCSSEKGEAGALL